MRVRVLVAATVLALTLGGCGGSESSGSNVPELSAKPSATPSATQPTTGTLLDKVPDKPERPQDVKSRAGANAFAKYALRMVVYALGTNDVESFDAIADGNLCTTCNRVKDVISKRPGTVELAQTKTLTLHGAKVTNVEGGFYTVVVTWDNPKSYIVDKKTGEVRKTSTPKTIRDYRDNYNLQWRQGKWVLRNYDVLKEDRG